MAYYRVSTQRQGASGLGLEAQQAAVRGYALRSGHDVATEFTEVECGRKIRRPQLTLAMAAAKDGGATLVVAKLDRLARDVRMILDMVDSGVPLLFLDLPDLPTHTPAGRMILVTMANLAEFESRRIGERIKDALARRRARLAEAGKAEPKKVFTKSHQQHASAAWHANDTIEACEFRKAMRPLVVGLRSELRTLAAAAQELNDRGIRTRRGNKWTAGLVHHILREIPG